MFNSFSTFFRTGQSAVIRSNGEYICSTFIEVRPLLWYFQPKNAEKRKQNDLDVDLNHGDWLVIKKAENKDK